MSDYNTILELIGTKNPQGLEELYNAYGTRFYAYAVKRWQLSEDEAWEVIYQTLETLVLKISNYQFASQQFFEAFLFKVLLNFIRQKFRSKRSKQFLAIEFADLNTEEGMPSHISKELTKSSFEQYYQAEIIDSPELQRLRQVLEELDETDRDILLLRAQQFSYDEIADLLHIENNQLKVRHHRAKQKLINSLNAQKK